jgi:hypothetical protein
VARRRIHRFCIVERPAGNGGSNWARTDASGFSTLPICGGAWSRAVLTTIPQASLIEFARQLGAQALSISGDHDFSWAVF